MLSRGRRWWARLRARVAAARPIRPQTVHEATVLPYARVRHASTSAALRREWRRAAWTCSRRNPELLLLLPGGYRVPPLLGIDGLDVHGPGAVLGGEGGDVLNVQGRSMLLSGVTIQQRGEHYPVHADCPGEGAELVLVDVTLRAPVKAALGVGLFAGQGVYAYGCRFDGGWTGVHAHNSHDQAAPAVFVFDGCKGDLSYTNLGSGQPDVWAVDDHAAPTPRRMPAHVRA